MLHEDDDPLSSSMFDTAASTNSILGNTMSSSIFGSQYQEEDPWGNHSIVESPSTTVPNRSFTTPNLGHYTNTTSDAATPRYNATTVLCKLGIVNKYVLWNTNLKWVKKKQKTAGIRLPSVYEQLFTQYQRSGRVSLSSLNNILSKGKISANHIELVRKRRYMSVGLRDILKDGL
jgi:hypothetical protein